LKDPNSPLTPSSGERLSPLAPGGAGVLWLQVSGLAAVQGAITLSWVIYRLYLDKLLVQFGFTAALAATLLVTENLLAAFMEPVMGGLSDRAKRIGTIYRHSRYCHFRQSYKCSPLGIAVRANRLGDGDDGVTQSSSVSARAIRCTS
jgi:hypothetical protein